MILSGQQIARAIDGESWKVWRDGNQIGSSDLKINPHSVNVTLGNKFAYVTADSFYINLRNPATMKVDYVQTENLLLAPGDCVLGYCRERFDCDAPLDCFFGWGTVPLNWVQKYDGRSTIGRLFIISHCTAGYFDYGFKSNGTLEIVNLSQNEVELRAGMEIGQISFEAIFGDVAAYSGAYVEQDERPRPAQLGKDRF